MLAEVGGTLRDELGLEPSRELRDLEFGILSHDPSLDPPPVARVRVDDEVGSPLIGRDRELGTLLAAHAAAPSDAQFVVLEGDPGIGKTRLASEFAAIAEDRGSFTVWARTNEIGTTQALWPWLDVVRAVIPRVDDAPEVLAGLLAGDAPLLRGRGDREPARTVRCHRRDPRGGGGRDAPRGAPRRPPVVRSGLARPASVPRHQARAWRRHGRDRAHARDRSCRRRDRCARCHRPATGHPAVAHGRPHPRRHRRAARRALRGARRLRPADAHPRPSRRQPLLHARARSPPRRAGRRRGRGARDRARCDPAPSRAASRRDARTCSPSPRSSTATSMSRWSPASPASSSSSAPIGSTPPPNTACSWSALTPRAGCGSATRWSERCWSTASPRSGGRGCTCRWLTSSRPPGCATTTSNWWPTTCGGPPRSVWASGPLRRSSEPLTLAVGRVAYTSAEEMLRRAVRLRQDVPPTPEALRAQLDAQLRLLAVMQATRYFSGTDRDLLHSTQELARRLGHDDVSRELTWSEWAALSRGADVAEARAIAEGYVQRWGDDPIPHVRASAHIVRRRDRLESWRDRRRHRAPRPGIDPVPRRPVAPELSRTRPAADRGGVPALLLRRPRGHDTRGSARRLRRAPRHLAADARQSPPAGVRAGVPGGRHPHALGGARESGEQSARAGSVRAVRLLRRPGPPVPRTGRNPRRRPRRRAGDLRRRRRRGSARSAVAPASPRATRCSPNNSPATDAGAMRQ